MTDMDKLTHSVAKHKGFWFEQPTRGMNHVLRGTMTRLVRNLPGHSYPGWSTAESRAEVAEKLLPAIRQQKGFKNSSPVEISKLSYEERLLLMQRKLITPSFAARQDGCHLILNRGMDTSVMINEEEHLVIHKFRPHDSIEKTYKEARQLADGIEALVPFARDRHWGYQSSIPAEAGDGVQFYAFLHLPAICLMNQIPPITRALEKLHLHITPFFTSYGEHNGDLYTVFTSPAPWQQAEKLLAHFRYQMDGLSRMETQIRDMLFCKGSPQLFDEISRGSSLLVSARMISYDELLELISDVELAIALGLVATDGAEADFQKKLRELYNTTAPALLSLSLDSEDEEQLAIQRARIIRSSLPPFSLSLPPL